MGKKKENVLILLKHRIPLKDVAKITGATYFTTKKAHARKVFDFRNLESVIGYINRMRRKNKLPELG